MTRRDAAKRLVIAIPFVPIYAFVLYPASLAVGLVLGALAVLWELATGDSPDWATDTAARAWAWPSNNMQVLMSGDGDFDWLP